MLAGCLSEEDLPESEGNPEIKDNVCVIPGYIVLETQSEVDSFAGLESLHPRFTDYNYVKDAGQRNRSCFKWMIRFSGIATF